MAGPNSSKEAWERSLANLEEGRMYWSKEDPEKVREIKRAGAEATNAKKQRARDIKSIYAELLQMDATPDILPDAPMVKAAQELAVERGQKISLYQAIALAQAAKAAKGDTGAAVFVRDSAGDKPTDKASIDGVLTAADEKLIRQMAAKLGVKCDNSADFEVDNS